MKILSRKSHVGKQHTICNNTFQKKSTHTSGVISIIDNRISHITQKKDIDVMKKKAEINNHSICQFVKNIDGREIPAKLYHVTTPENWTSIQKSGLGFPRKRLWLSSTKGSAVSGTASILLEVDTTDIPTDRIRLANDCIESYGDNKVWIFQGRLKKSRLTVVS